MIYLIAAILLFSIFDYFGYNISEKKDWVNEKLINPYRVIQTAVQILLTVMLHYLIGGLYVGLFIFLWWFGVCDLIYYAIDWALNKVWWNMSYEKGEFWEKDRNYEMSWLWFTPYGLLGLAVTKGMFFDQCIFAVIVSVIILLTV